MQFEGFIQVRVTVLHNGQDGKYSFAGSSMDSVCDLTLYNYCGFFVAMQNG